MLVFPTLALLLASLSSAARIDLVRDEASHDASIEADMQYVLHKYAAIAKHHYNRTGEHLNIVNLEYVDQLRANAQKRASSQTRLRKSKNWSGQIEVGFPPQKSLVVFDTGSADLFVDKSSYHPKLSLTSKNVHKPFDFSYETLHVYGDVYIDDVSIGGVKAKQVPLGHGSKDFDGEVTGGTLGLSFATAENRVHGFEQDPFMWAAKKQHLIQSSTYQFTLRPNGKATLNVGKIDLFELGGLITWSDKNTDKTFWRTTVEFNGHKMENALLDTGTNVISGPNDQVKDILDQIDGMDVQVLEDGSYQGTYDCRHPPNLEFKVLGQTFKLPEEALNFGYAGDKCFSSIIGSPGMNEWLLGSPFFQVGSIIFNFDVRRMGIAKSS